MGEASLYKTLHSYLAKWQENSCESRNSGDWQVLGTCTRCIHLVAWALAHWGAKFVQPSGRTGTKEVIYGVPQRRWCKTCRIRQHDAVRNKRLRRAARLACPHCWQVTPGSVLWKVISSCSIYIGPLVQWRQQSLHPCSLKTTSGSVLLQLFWTTALSCPTESPPKYVLCAVQVWLDFTTAKWSQLVGETALGKAAPWWGCTTATE